MEIVPVSRSTLARVRSVGRATVFVVGLATMVAMLLGVASMAFAGNGDPWILASSTPPLPLPGSRGRAAWTVPCSS
jgi:hypothetical protein